MACPIPIDFHTVKYFLKVEYFFGALSIDFLTLSSLQLEQCKLQLTYHIEIVARIGYQTLIEWYPVVYNAES